MLYPVIAGQRQVFRGITAAMLAGNDVVDMEGGEGDVRLEDSAVFTATAGTPADQTAPGSIHQVWP